MGVVDHIVHVIVSHGKIGPVSEFTLTAPDGVPLLGELLPASHSSDPLELAFFVAHGFTGSHEKPHVRQISEWLTDFGAVLSVTFRGHGRSGGEATFGLVEIEDMNVAIRYLRELGYRKVATVGWSMGSGNAILHAAAVSAGPAAVDAVVSVSGASRWYLRDTKAMRRVQFVINKRIGRLIARRALQTRIAKEGWGELGPDNQRVLAPPHPVDAVAEIKNRPILFVHGDQDSYFGIEHARALFDAAPEPKELLLIDGFGHAESAATESIVNQIGAWVRANVGLPAMQAPAETRGTISE